MPTPDWADERLSTDLLVLRSQGESQQLEFIESFPQHVRELAKEIAAFATSNAGTILVGVANSGDLKGLVDAETPAGRDSLLRRLEGICRGTVKPAITPVAKFAVEEGKVVLVMQVPKGRQPIYYCGHIPYVRHLTESRPADPHEVLELISEHLGQNPLISDESGVNPRTELYSALARILIEILIYADESSEREVNPWLDMWRSEFGYAASELRQLAVQDTAIEDGLDTDLQSLATSLDQVASFRLHIGSGPDLRRLVNAVKELTQRIKLERVDIARLSDGSPVQIGELIVQTSRKLSNLVSRSMGLTESGRTEDLQSEASSLGHALLRVSHYGIEDLGEGVADELRRIGRELHLIETVRLYMDGGQSQQAIQDRIARCSDSLVSLIGRLRRGKQE